VETQCHSDCVNRPERVARKKAIPLSLPTRHALAISIPCIAFSNSRSAGEHALPPKNRSTLAIRRPGWQLPQPTIRAFRARTAIHCSNSFASPFFRPLTFDNSRHIYSADQPTARRQHCFSRGSTPQHHRRGAYTTGHSPEAKSQPSTPSADIFHTEPSPVPERHVRR
jgi:hypothetical protein